MQRDLKELGGLRHIWTNNKRLRYFWKPRSGGINNSSRVQLRIGIMNEELLNRNQRVSNQARSERKQDRSERATCFSLSPPEFWPPITAFIGQTQPEARGQEKPWDEFCRGQPPRAQSRAEMDREWIRGRWRIISTKCFKIFFNFISQKIQQGLEWRFSNVWVSGTFFTI